MYLLNAFVLLCLIALNVGQQSAIKWTPYQIRHCIPIYPPGCKGVPKTPPPVIRTPKNDTHCFGHCGGKDVGCHPTFPSWVGITGRVITITKVYKRTALKIINDLRNEVAGGYELSCGVLPQAARLSETYWNKDLAEYAQYFAMQCRYPVSGCASLVAFPNYGINSIQIKSYKKIENADVIIRDGFKQWTKLISHIRIDIINSFKPSPFDNVLRIINERSNQVGIGITEYHDGKRYVYTFVALFSYNNVASEVVYIPGAVGSLCTTGHSPTYPNLCTVNEKVCYELEQIEINIV